MTGEVKKTAIVGLDAADVSPPGATPQDPPIACANCQTPLKGGWCYVCGQRESDAHRSVRHLFAESFEGLTHVDSRLWRTLNRLARAPGSLTRDYLDGKRVPQIPPFRMFLAVVLILFFAGSLGDLGPRRSGIHLDASVQSSPAPPVKGTSKLVFDRNTPMAGWLNSHVQTALAHPEAVAHVMENWAHQFAILSLFVAAPLLALVYAFQRQFRFYDHLIFSMHSLSFQGLLLSAVFLAGLGFSGAGWLLVLSPIHLFAHMRGAYRISILGTLIRMALLFVGSCIAVGFLLAGLAVVGLATAH